MTIISYVLLGVMAVLLVRTHMLVSYARRRMDEHFNEGENHGT